MGGHVLYLKVKVTKAFAIALHTWVRLVARSALQCRKWQLIGMGELYRSALCAIHCPRQWTIGPAVCS